jgi:xylulokinase
MANRQLIAGVDSSTKSVKVVIREANTGELVRQGRASHPDGGSQNNTYLN